MEMVAGLAIVGVLFVGITAMLRQLADANERFVFEAHRADERANGLRLLRETVYDLEAGTDTAERFVGTEHVARFVSWCRTPGGWLEQCHVTLRLIPVGDSTALVGTLSGAGTYDLWEGAGEARFLYFTRSVPDDTWVGNWGNSIAPPGAIGVATHEALMVLGAGGRG